MTTTTNTAPLAASAATLAAIDAFAMGDAAAQAALPVSSFAPAVRSAEIEKHLALVNQVVARFMKKLPANVERGDLVTAGMCGLARSLEKNGGDAGETFEGYAKMRIRGAILDELRSQDWLSRRARAAVAAEGYAGPRAVVGIEDVSEGERETSFADTTSGTALEALEAAGDRKALEAAVSRLPAREASVIARHYFEGVGFKDIAAQMGVSQPRVSQIHTRALGLLRDLVAVAA